MTSEVAYGFDDEEYEQAVERMKEKQIRRVPVVNRQKHLVGIVSLGDVAVRGDDDNLSADAVERLSIPRKK